MIGTSCFLVIVTNNHKIRKWQLGCAVIQYCAGAATTCYSSVHAELMGPMRYMCLSTDNLIFQDSLYTITLKSFSTSVVEGSIR